MTSDGVICKKKGLVALLIALCVLFSSCSIPVGNMNFIGNGAEDAKYTLHVGLNDKDTYKQEISDEKAMKIVTDTSLKYADGFTVYRCQGIYKDTKGAVTKENSLVLEYFGTDEKKVRSIMDDLLVSLNQESILVEKKGVTYEFYRKKEDKK